MEMKAFTTALEEDLNITTTEEPYFSNFVLAARIAIGLTAGLSLIGAIIVIAYQLCFRYKEEKYSGKN